MTADHISDPALTIGEPDTQLSDRLNEELVAFNTAATGASDRGAFSVKVTDDAGELVGGLAAWTWGGLCGIELLWVREDSRKDGWGSRLLQAAEAEAQRRGCDRVAVSGQANRMSHLTVARPLIGGLDLLRGRPAEAIRGCVG